LSTPPCLMNLSQSLSHLARTLVSQHPSLRTNYLEYFEPFLHQSLGDYPLTTMITACPPLIYHIPYCNPPLWKAVVEEWRVEHLARIKRSAQQAFPPTLTPSHPNSLDLSQLPPMEPTSLTPTTYHPLSLPCPESSSNDNNPSHPDPS
jgi:hypothetical protein